MTPRSLGPELRTLATHYPVVAVTGPRQSGKTTLCRAVFPQKPYVSLEALDVRELGCHVNYGGDASQRRSQARVLSWRDFPSFSTVDD